MSIRKERFCDFMKEGKPDYSGNKTIEQCTDPAIGTCFFCKRDYCKEHEASYYKVELTLAGFKQDFRKVLPCCHKCEGQLPYNPDALVLKHFERCWRAIKRSIRAEIKLAKIKAKTAREKREAKAEAKAAAKAAAKAEKGQKAEEAVAETADAKP